MCSADYRSPSSPTDSAEEAIFYAEQVGPNVVINGSGSFNTTLLTPTGTNAVAFNIVGTTFIANVQAGTNTVYSGTMNSFSANTATNIAFGSGSGDSFSFDIGASPSYNMWLPNSYTSNAPLSNSMTVSGSLAGIGWSTAGTYASPVLNRSFTLDTGDTVQIFSVPEPTHMVFVAGIGAALGAWRLRKLRRNRETAGDATAS
jgi:hypothetical protein